MLNRTGTWIKPLAIMVPLALMVAGCASNADLAAARKSAADAAASAAQAAQSAKNAEAAAQKAEQNSERANREFRQNLRK